MQVLFSHDLRYLSTTQDCLNIMPCSHKLHDVGDGVVWDDLQSEELLVPSEDRFGGVGSEG